MINLIKSAVCTGSWQTDEERFAAVWVSHPADMHNEYLFWCADSVMHNFDEMEVFFMQDIITRDINVFSELIKPITGFLNIFSNFWVSTGLVAIVFLALVTVCTVWYGRESAQIIKKPQTLAICAMLIAINAVLGQFTLPISESVRIGFGFVTVPVASMLYGPLVGCAMGMLQDVVSLMIKPTGGLIIALTLNAGMMGIIYSTFFYKRKVTVLRVISAQFIVVCVINIVLNSVALAPVVGGGMAGILPGRLIKNIVMLPIQIMIMYLILKTVDLKIKGISGSRSDSDDKQDYKS